MATPNQITVMSFPTRIVLGPGAITQTPAELERHGVHRPLVVSDPGLVQVGLVKKLTDVLSAAGLDAAVFSQIDSNPVEANVDGGVAAYREHRADGLVAIGGGASLDVAKAIRLMTTHPGPLEKYDDLDGGDRFITPNLPPMW